MRFTCWGLYLVSTCNEKVRSAGIGMMDAERKARIFVTDVRNTEAPVLFRHSAVWSCKNTARITLHALTRAFILYTCRTDVDMKYI
jgi:hypothetical protein